MNQSAPKAAKLLDSRLIYLSAAIPESEEEAENAEEALLSLARAVYAEGGRLLINQDETIVTLVVLVAGEYFEAQPEEEQKEGIPAEARRRERAIERAPAPLIVLRRDGDQVAGREGDQVEDQSFLERSGYLQISRPDDRFNLLAGADAMLCIGRQSAADWLDFERSAPRRRPVVVFPATGADGPPRSNDWNLDSPMREIQQRFEDWMREHRRLESPSTREEEFEEPERGTTYPVLTQLLVERLASEWRG